MNLKRKLGIKLQKVDESIINASSLLIDYCGEATNEFLTLRISCFSRDKGIYGEILNKEALSFSSVLMGNDQRLRDVWSIDKNVLQELHQVTSVHEYLLQAYLDTIYKVFEPSLEIQIGRHSAKLDEVLDRYGVEEWAYITSWNPNSTLVSEIENQQLFLELQVALEGFKFSEGEGMGTDPNWIPEKSLLVFGIPLAQAEMLGKRFGQNAIVVGAKGESAKLMIHL